MEGALGIVVCMGALITLVVIALLLPLQAEAATFATPAAPLPAMTVTSSLPPSSLS